MITAVTPARAAPEAVAAVARPITAVLAVSAAVILAVAAVVSAVGVDRVVVIIEREARRPPISVLEQKNLPSLFAIPSAEALGGAIGARHAVPLSAVVVYCAVGASPPSRHRPGSGSTRFQLIHAGTKSSSRWHFSQHSWREPAFYPPNLPRHNSQHSGANRSCTSTMSTPSPGCSAPEVVAAVALVVIGDERQVTVHRHRIPVFSRWINLIVPVVVTNSICEYLITTNNANDSVA
jgi:hypothetical protein